VTNRSEGASFQAFEIAFGVPIGPLRAGRTYYLNFENRSSNGKKYYLEYSGADVYPAGTYFKSGSNDGKDIWFQVWGGAAGSAPSKVSLTVATQGEGTVSPPGGEFDVGSVVTLRATPALGWRFSGWSGALTGSENPAALTMDSSKSVTASFVAASDSVLTSNLTGSSKIEVNLGQKGAQSFRIGAAGGADYWITRVVLHLSRDLEAPTGDLRFSLCTGVNSGALAGSSIAIRPAQVTNSSAGASFQTFEIAFSAPVGPLRAGTAYYLDFESESSNGKKYYLQYSGADVYPGGTYFKSGSNDGKDIWFQVWGRR
jgi:hypothetical protein